MARQARLDAPGVLHHVIIRGIERRKIFLDNKDRDDIIDRLSSILQDARMACYGWALMSNHCPSPKLDPTSLKKQNCHFGHYFN